MCTGRPGKDACAVLRFCTGLHRSGMKRRVRGGGIVVAHGPGRSGNYLRKLVEATGRNPAKPGEVRHIRVIHDEWCSMIAGRGPCDCDPSIEIPGREQ